MYQSCSEKWRLHYQERLRGPKLYSALFFGSALDEAFTRLLLDKKSVKTPEELVTLTWSAEDIFYKYMLNVEHNGETVEVAKSPLVDYYASDFEPSLLTPKSLDLLRAYAPDVDDYIAFHEACKAAVKGKKTLSEADLALYNYITWLTLVEKGLLIIQAYREQVMPQIKEVFSIQERVTLPNADGDYITGLIDFTAEFVDEPGTSYVCDNKSSSKPYKADSVANSDQLATYCEFKDTNKAAYVVAEKKLYKKNGPAVRVQIIKDTISEATFALTFKKFEEVLYNANNQVFEKNFKACFDYGKTCAFYRLCKYGSREGLIQLPPRKEN